MSAEYRIKKYLNDIIDVAYAGASEDELRRYKGFKIKITPKELHTSSGVYHFSNRLIEIYNPSLGAKHMTKCCLHELSHHIDHCQHGTSGHQKPFYGIYKKLIFASLDMGILEKNDFIDKFSSDRNKVIKMLDDYHPHPVNYKKSDDGQIVKVFNCYDIKENLKDNKYYWNNLEQAWEKETDQISEEIRFLDELGVLSEADSKNPYYSIQKADMYINAAVIIEATGNTYQNKENLKQNGFYFSHKSKKWLKKIIVTKQDNIRLHMHKYVGELPCPGVSYKVINRN